MISSAEYKLDVNLGRRFSRATTKTTLWLVRLQKSMIVWLGQLKRKGQFDSHYFMAISIGIKLTSEVVSHHGNLKKQEKNPLKARPS